MLHETTPLRFECTGCGRCCIGGGEYHVFLTDAEAETIRQHLQLSRAWFRRRYLRHLPDGDQVAVMGKDGRCIFLGKDNGCKVYAARPVQCRTYPFWPEVLNSRTSWTREAKRCEGIDRGKIVAVSRIRKALASQS
jgi:uncharacterized protein